MALMIRLRQQGRRGDHKYRLVLTEGRNPRDGKYTENLGWYDPAQAEDDRNALVKADRVRHWVEQGAVLTEKAEKLIKRTAPEIIRERNEREAAKRAKAQAKRREARKKKAAAAK